MNKIIDFFKPVINVIKDKEHRNVNLPFIWHGFFLALTMSMIELNTVLPNLISELTKNSLVFGAMYSIMLGAPLVFNLLFSKFLQKFEYKKKFLLFGIYLRSFSFLGMSLVTFFFAKSNPILTLVAFYFLILTFSLSGGFSGIAYSDIVGKLLPKEKRGSLIAARQIIGGGASLLGGFLIAKILSPGTLSFPSNYALSLGIGFLGLILGAVGFWRIKETPSKISKSEENKKENLFKSTAGILKEDRKFFKFIVVENMTSFSLMILPFYMLFVKSSFPNAGDFLGIFVLASILGSIFSNFLWAYLSSKFGGKAVVKTCIFIGASLPLIAILLKPLGVSWYLLLFLLVGSISSGRLVGFEPYLLEIAPEEKRTIYLGIRGSMNIFVVILPLVGGLFINSFGYLLTFIFVSMMMFSAFLLMNKKETR